MVPLVSLSDLTVTWEGAGTADPIRALDGVSLTIGAGAVVGIVGEAGSGQSTLLRCLAGIVPQLVRATVTGAIEVAGHDPRVIPVADLAGDVAIVLDDPEAQTSQATVAEEVAFGLENLAVPVAEMRDRVTSVLGRVGLAGFEDRHPLTLSGGEQQRLAVACAVAMRPRLLLMDGPTSSLDRRAGRRLLGLVRELARERSMAVVVADHDVELVADYVDRILVLEGGRLVHDASPAVALAALARSDPLAPVPPVTALAAAFDPGAPGLPATLGEAVRWLAGRGWSSPA